MGLWSAYFLVKLLLYARGDMDFDPWANLAFAGFAALPPGNVRQRFAKNLLAVPLGALLLCHDSWLPPITQLLSQIQRLHSVEPLYLGIFVYRSISWKLLAELAVMLLVYAVLRRKLRMSTFAFIGILLAIIVPSARFVPQSQAAHIAAADPARVPAADIDARNMSSDALDARLAQIYAAERTRQVRFSNAVQDGSPYDVLILHVSSLSWDDLQTVKQTEDSLFRRFDIVLTQFNSAASYGGPAVIRLLRGTCGQTPERLFADAVGRECSVPNGLKGAGFEFQWLMNHDGRLDNVSSTLRTVEDAAAPLDDKGAEISQQAADGSSIYGDYSSLSRWLAKRTSDHAARVVLYYNTSSLRDGNRMFSAGHGDSSYAGRLSRLSAELSRFLDDLQRSGRHAVVLFIAEHGAALTGDRRQITGLREIPTPAIAHVPVGIALINVAQQSPWTQQRIESPTSYLAVNELLARFVADNPFDKALFSPAAYIQGLPGTEFVAENDGTTVIRIARQDMMRAPDGTWSSLGAAEEP